jgi:hypothetical protein
MIEEGGQWMMGEAVSHSTVSIKDRLNPSRR